MNGPGMGCLKRLAIAGANLIAPLQVGLLLFYFILYALSDGELWYIDALGMILPWLFAPLFVLLPLALWLRRRVLWALVGTSLALFLFTYGHLYLPALPARGADPAFTVMTYNLFFRNLQSVSILDEIERHDPDVIAVQELTTAQQPLLSEKLAAGYPYSDFTADLGLFSRYPLSSCEMLRERGDIKSRIQRCSLQVHDRTVTVLHAHTRAPRVEAERILGLPLFAPTMVDKTLNENDVQAVLTLLEEADGPVVALGDFNLSDRWASYGELRRYLQDAHRARGWGLGLTYTRFRPLGIPIWRIDYVFYSPELVALEVRLGDFSGSDHRPVIARLGFAER